MKSQINLLQNELIPKFEWICATNFVAFVTMISLLCGGAYGLAFYQHQQAEKNVAKIKAKISSEQNSINELTNALTARVTNPLLKSKLAGFKEQTRVRGQLLDHIRNLSALKQRSFSVLFDSLAQSNSNDLWLTNFKVNPIELNLQGQLVKPRALPVWIDQLSKTGFFKGQEFNVASVARDQDALVFTLHSKQKETNNDFANSNTIILNDKNVGGKQ